MHLKPVLQPIELALRWLARTFHLGRVLQLAAQPQP